MKPFLLHFFLFTVIVVLLLGVSTIGVSQPRVNANFRSGIDSLLLKRMPRQTPDNRFMHNGILRSISTIQGVNPSHSPIYVIDTIVVCTYDKDYDMIRHLCTFNGSGRTTNVLEEGWNTGNGQWKNYRRHTYAYDADTNMVTDLWEWWMNGQWENILRWTYTYDVNGKRLSELDEEWSNGQWMQTRRYTYTYDANANSLKSVHQEWSNGQWMNVVRLTFTYDVDGNELTMLSELPSGSQWVNEWRYTYTYDANGNTLTDSSEYWSNGQWGLQDMGRNTYTYDEKGNMLSDLRETWSNGQFVVVSNFHWTYTYDGNGNMLARLFDFDSGPDLSRWTYAYDAQGHVTSASSDYWQDSSWTPAGDSFSVTDGAGNYYGLHCYHITLTYKMIVTGVASENGTVPAIFSLFQNHPNPFNPSTTIKYELPRASQVTLTVHDILGRVVSVLVNERRNAGVHEVKFDGSNLASGVYFYRIQAGDFVSTKGMLILK